MEKKRTVSSYTRRKKKKSNIGVGFACVLCVAALSGLIVWLFMWVYASTPTGLLERTWKKADADGFRALFVNEFPQERNEENSQEEGSIRYLSDEELSSILNASPIEQEEASADLLKTMMERGELKAKKDGDQYVLLTITVPDLGALLDKQKISGEEDIRWLIGLVESQGKDIPMRTQTVRVEYFKEGQDICYRISNELLDAVYASLPSSYSEAVSRYYEMLGEKVKRGGE